MERQNKYIGLFLFFFLCLCCWAHPNAAMHYNDMRCAFNGFDGEVFRDFCEHTISSGIDSELPDMFRSQIGSVPGNHRILGHGWSLNDPIPKKVLQTLTRRYPDKEKEIIEIWRAFSNKITEKTILVTGLPKNQANAFASMLWNIHLLGDVEPGNVRVDLVLSPHDISRNIINNAEILFKNKPEYISLIRRRLNFALHGLKNKSQEQIAQTMMDEIYRLRMGDMLHQTWGKTIRSKAGHIEYSVQNAVNTNERIAKRFLSRTPGHPTSNKKQSPLSRRQFEKGGSGKTRMCAGMLTADGRLIVALEEGAKIGLIVFATEAGIATYQYVKGSILKPEFHEKLIDAAIKGGTVGSATAVAVVLGSNPGGWVVLAVSTGVYVVTDFSVKLWHEHQAKKYLTREDLAVYGIQLDTTLEMPIDSTLEMPVDSTLEMPVDSTL